MVMGNHHFLWNFIVIEWDFMVIKWDINGIYPLVMTNIAMENHHFLWENPQITIFNSYVKLPEGNPPMNCHTHRLHVRHMYLYLGHLWGKWR